MGKGKNQKHKQQRQHQDKFAAPEAQEPRRGGPDTFDENPSLDDTLDEAATPGFTQDRPPYGDR